MRGIEPGGEPIVRGGQEKKAPPVYSDRKKAPAKGKKK
jgi:hypothetical protein